MIEPDDTTTGVSLKNFADWHADVFGYGYWTGEQYWIPALHSFFVSVLDENLSYRHDVAESVLGALSAWLMINTLCGGGILEYGTSPRFGWCTHEGRLLAAFIRTRSPDELLAIVTQFPDDKLCARGWCWCADADTDDDSNPYNCNPLFGSIGRID